MIEPNKLASKKFQLYSVKYFMQTNAVQNVDKTMPGKATRMIYTERNSTMKGNRAQS